MKSVYQDGDVALYLLQLLGSFGEKTIQDKYSESQGNFFKFFKKLIEMKKFDGGGGKRKNSSAQNEAVKKSKNKNSGAWLCLAILLPGCLCQESGRPFMSLLQFSL